MRVGHINNARALIKNGADVNFDRGLGETPLTELAATKKNDDKVVNPHVGFNALERAQLLIDNGAEVNKNSEDKFYDSALDNAKLHGTKEMVDFLVKNGAK